MNKIAPAFAAGLFLDRITDMNPLNLAIIGLIVAVVVVGVVALGAMGYPVSFRSGDTAANTKPPARRKRKATKKAARRPKPMKPEGQGSKADGAGKKGPRK